MSTVEFGMWMGAIGLVLMLIDFVLFLERTK
jgi:hypothetical protein